MKTLIIILIFYFWIPLINNFHGEGPNFIYQVSPKCEMEFDSVTKRTVYIRVEQEAENEGGLSALMRKYQKISLQTIPEDFDTQFIVAFIVEADGKITGERIIKDKVGNVGQQIIEIAKSFKWTAAVCNGKKVTMLKKLNLQMCLDRN